MRIHLNHLISYRYSMVYLELSSGDIYYSLCHAKDDFWVMSQGPTTVEELGKIFGKGHEASKCYKI